jgi:hypothetical protein
MRLVTLWSTTAGSISILFRGLHKLGDVYSGSKSNAQANRDVSRQKTTQVWSRGRRRRSEDRGRHQKYVDETCVLSKQPEHQSDRYFAGSQGNAVALVI